MLSVGRGSVELCHTLARVSRPSQVTEQFRMPVQNLAGLGLLSYAETGWFAISDSSYVLICCKIELVALSCQ